jgi:hypothetical protein
MKRPSIPDGKSDSERFWEERPLNHGIEVSRLSIIASHQQSEL